MRNANVKTWEQRNPDKVKAYRKKTYTTERRRKYQLKALYNLTPEDHKKMLDEQGGRCLICGSDAELHVDHDHKTNVVRGLLCTKCNTGLGLFCDSPELLEAATAYLRRF